MPKICYLCDNKSSKDGNKTHTMHKFPKNESVRKQWLDACKLSVKDDTCNVYICSSHFRNEDYRDSRGVQRTSSLLKPGSVPSINIPNLVNTNVEYIVNINGKPQPNKNTNPNVEEIELIADSDNNIVDDSSQKNEERLQTPRKRKCLESHYIAEISSPDVATPKRARLETVASFKELIAHLTEENMMSNEAANTLMEIMPQNMRDILEKKMKNNGHYSSELRSFALTLYFYSPEAYNYVRTTWNNLLPNPSTIRNWYQVVDGSPGFTKEAFSLLKMRAEEREKAGKPPVIVNLVLDEMSIRKDMIYDKNRFIGGVDIGTVSIDNRQIDDFDNDNENNEAIEPASSALMFMAVSLNEHWQVPIGYFLIRSLNGNERANLFTQALLTLHECKCKVYSTTFNGHSSNFAMCTALGANFEYGPNFKPFFEHPITSEKCFVFLDLCHAIKLVRNTLGDYEILQTTRGEQIKWDYIVKLHALQAKNGSRAPNKLTKKHIEYKHNRTNVKLAMQTVSRSVYNSLKFLTSVDDDILRQEFKGCMPTANFCLQFNNMTDVLNCKNMFSKDKYNRPLNENTYAELKACAKNFEVYINILCDQTGKPILRSARRVGFLGIIISLRNIFELFDAIKPLGQNYLLSYKLSRDYLETFFSAIRARGRFSNNPNAFEIKSAYKLLIRHELKELENGNCLFGIDILHVNAKPKSSKCPTEEIDYLRESIEIRDHDYIKTY